MSRYATPTELADASRLGQAAFARNAVPAPGVDADLLALLGDPPVGEPRTLELFRAWAAAYDAEVVDRVLAELFE